MNWEVLCVGHDNEELVLAETSFGAWNLHTVEKHINLSLISFEELGSAKSRHLIAAIKL